MTGPKLEGCLSPLSYFLSLLGAESRCSPAFSTCCEPPCPSLPLPASARLNPGAVCLQLTKASDYSSNHFQIAHLHPRALCDPPLVTHLSPSDILPAPLLPLSLHLSHPGLNVPPGPLHCCVKSLPVFIQSPQTGDDSHTRLLDP
jgi:hypothetical protein